MIGLVSVQPYEKKTESCGNKIMGPNKKSYILTGFEAEIGKEAGLSENKQVTHLTILIVILKSDGLPTSVHHTQFWRGWRQPNGKTLEDLFALSTPYLALHTKVAYSLLVCYFIYVYIVLNNNNKKTVHCLVSKLLHTHGLRRSSVLWIGGKKVLVKMQLWMWQVPNRRAV